MREDDLRLLLTFMYHGEVQVRLDTTSVPSSTTFTLSLQVEQERISTFLRTAETLQIQGLADHPLKEQCQKTSSVSSGT